MWKTAKEIIGNVQVAMQAIVFRESYKTCPLCKTWHAEKTKQCKECYNALQSAKYHVKKYEPVKQDKILNTMSQTFLVIAYAYHGKKRKHFMHKYRYNKVKV